MDGTWWRVAEVCFVSAIVAPLALVTAFCAGWWVRGAVFGWEVWSLDCEEAAMIDVERIRRAALMRIEHDRVGMVMTCQQVLELIARGDVRVAVYEARIAELEGELERLQMDGDDLEDEDDEEEDGLVCLKDFAETSGMSVSGLTRLITEGRIYGVKRQTECADGQIRTVWFLDETQATAWMALSLKEKHAVARGELQLMEGD